MNNEPQDSLKILIAEDSASDRFILETIVAKAGHIPIGVADGEQALTAFQEKSPDVVLLDVLMPNMGGIEAARKIRDMGNEDMVPIIFLTSLKDQADLVECLEAGGDDFIPKPYNPVVLQSKIKSFGRLRRMHTTLLNQKAQIEEHNRHLIQEQTVAKQVFDKIAPTGCLDMGNIRHYMSPLAVFNGDVLVSEFSPNGNMVVMLGDFTGHGLPAAIGSMPLASTFYGMVRKGFSMSDILREINQKLNDILPIGFFCCAICVDINFKERRIKVWNGGLPEAFLYLKSTGKYELLASKNLPLGVLPSKSFNGESQTFQLDYGDRLYMWSDGAFEARNQAGEMFGEENLHQIFYDNIGDKDLFDKVLNNVQAHIGSTEKDDDMSLVEIEMQDVDVVAKVDQFMEKNQGCLSDWYMNFDLPENSLKEFDPLPLLMNIISEVPGLRQHRTPLYTVLAELYSNALEHGVLGLKSELKSSPGGFASYYNERTKRLQELVAGKVSFQLSHTANGNGGYLNIRVKDSGEGFTVKKTENKGVSQNLYGRGLSLIQSLTKSIEIHEPGNDIEVVYYWERED
ncbi:SpoIIE family protein phosphatase [Agarilytica rhodophyticola]|uniref:SpoIIE family protein phosphatase n=1 Tax=Agarilytica rhodophyticola TaxID=1737490 RepID=UPI000B347051|nr:SpoIIE family protein phosphatase [Agarilytica rhodophyticola]